MGTRHAWSVVAAGLLALALATTGCAHDRRVLSPGALTAARAKTLVLYTEENQRFDDGYDPPWRRGLMGEVAHSDSERLAKQRGIVDPAFGVGESLASALAGAYALDRVTVSQVVRRPQMGVDLILDVNTTWWGLRSGPSNPIGRYAVHLEMEAILTDLRSGAVLARGTCTGDDPRTVHGAPYDEFEAENGAKIKRQLGWAAERCERYFRERILGVPSVEVASGR